MSQFHRSFAPASTTRIQPPPELTEEDAAAQQAQLRLRAKQQQQQHHPRSRAQPATQLTPPALTPDPELPPIPQQQPNQNQLPHRHPPYPPTIEDQAPADTPESPSPSHHPSPAQAPSQHPWLGQTTLAPDFEPSIGHASSQPPPTPIGSSDPTILDEPPAIYPGSNLLPAQRHEHPPATQAALTETAPTGLTKNAWEDARTRLKEHTALLANPKTSPQARATAQSTIDQIHNHLAQALQPAPEDSTDRRASSSKSNSEPQLSFSRNDSNPKKHTYSASDGTIYNQDQFLAQNGPGGIAKKAPIEKSHSIPGISIRGNFHTESKTINNQQYTTHVADPKEALERQDRMYGLKEDQAGEKQKYAKECVSLCKALAGLPATQKWVKGQSMQSAYDTRSDATGRLTPGTAVAIFSSDDKYHSDHSGIFLGFGTQERDGVQQPGFYMLNQYPYHHQLKKPAYPHIKFQFFNDTRTHSHNASNFSVIYIPQAR